MGMKDHLTWFVGIGKLQISVHAVGLLAGVILDFPFVISSVVLEFLATS